MKTSLKIWMDREAGTLKRGLVFAVMGAFCITSMVLIQGEIPSIIGAFFEFLGPLWPLLVWHGCWSISSALLLMASEQSRRKSLADLEFIGTFAPVIGVAGTVAGLMITFWYLMPVFAGTLDTALLGQSFKQVIGGSFKAFGSSLSGYLICLFCAHCIKFAGVKNSDGKVSLLKCTDERNELAAEALHKPTIVN